MLFVSCLKPILFSRYLNFCLDFYGHVGKRPDKRARLIPEFMKQIITIDMLRNISESKGNQAMKFGQLIEYNMRNLCLEK